ncbi:MAG: DedA family protein [Fimbriimonadaceae bacterium]
MQSINNLFHFLLHIDEKVGPLIHRNGNWTYAIFFAVLFAETGLVVTPFLPGDTLLFFAGLFARPEKHSLNIYILLPLMTLAPLCGDSTNFMIGKWFGSRLFSDKHSKIFRRSALDKTHEFFEKHGQKTIVLARWVAIVRTFAPFVAGMGRMPYLQFIRFSAIGAFFWVWGCMLAGYFFGAIPAVSEHFSFAILAMLLVGAIPIALEILKQRQEFREREARAKSTAPPEPHKAPVAE